MTDIPWGPTGQLVYERTYSRTKPDGTKETWPETVRRVVDGNLALGDPRHELPGERDDLIDYMERFAILPAGRHLWASGVKGRQYLFNCHNSGWGEGVTEHFEFTFLRLMEGGGVGANYSNRHLEQYPEITGHYRVHVVCSPDHPDYEKLSQAGVLSTEYGPDWAGAYEVEDSREGWADALSDLLGTYYRDAENTNRVFDVSRVRAEGSRLKTFGGRASGPLPLAVMLRDVAYVMNMHESRRLTGIGAMEIDHAIAQCVVSGGTRRSARMAIMHWDDPQIADFLWCKTNTGSHWTTNISVEVDNEFWVKVNEGDLHASLVLDSIVDGMLSNGEPGFWYSSYSNEGEPNPVTATNPCLTGDTVIATVDGPRTFADLADAGEDVEVYSWHPKTKTPVVRWMRRPHKTAENTEVLKVTFDSGLVVRCTPEHGFYSFRGRKVQAKNLKPGQSVRAFSASRDGSGHERVHGWDSKRNTANHQWTHRMIWENTHGPIEDGYVIAHLDHDATNNELPNLAAMTPYEHASYDYPLRAEAGFNGHCRNHKVVSVESGGFADVYNGMVEDAHTYIVLDPEPVSGHMSGIVSANCGEIPLEAWENCNLGHVNLAVFVNRDGTVDGHGLFKAHELVTRFLIRATNGDVNDSKQAAVLARNRRIGVGHLGFASMVAKMGIRYSDVSGNPWVADLIANCANEVSGAAQHYTHKLRIPGPVKTRTVAPTGTIAKMPGVSEGIHPIFARYFIRRVRLSTINPDEWATAVDYAARGYDVEPDQYATNTMVVSIPTKDSLFAEVEAMYGTERAEAIVQSAEDLSLYDMLSVQAFYQTVWADNAVSYTANVDPARYGHQEVVNVLRSLGPSLKGATVFPETSMPQAPYERITKADYEEATAKAVADSVDENCVSGACPVK